MPQYLLDIGNVSAMLENGNCGGMSQRVCSKFLTIHTNSLESFLADSRDGASSKPLSVVALAIADEQWLSA